MEKTLVSLRWKLRVFDAVIIPKLLYGLEAIPFTEQDCKQLDALQYRGLRQVFGIKHFLLVRSQEQTRSPGSKSKSKNRRETNNSNPNLRKACQ